MWSNAMLLNSDNIQSVPNNPGVYEIGFHRTIFRRRYVGRSITSIRARLQAHIRDDGNYHVGNYLGNAERNNLYFRYAQVEDPVATEIRLLRKYEAEYEWNERMEYNEEDDL